MAHCTGQKIHEEGTFHCDDTPVAAYTWHGVPFNYNGAPGAAVCANHEAQLKKYEDRYPSLKLVERIEKTAAQTFDHEWESSGKGWPGICGRCGGDHKPVKISNGREAR